MNKLRDFEQAATIKLALIHNPRVGGLEIGVQVVNGIVFLTGAVQGTEQKELAEQIARSHGGMDIKNDIQVLGEADNAEGLPMDDIVPQSFIAQSEEDLLIRDRVLGDLESDGRVNSLMINVDAADGTVRLSGLQNDEIARARAEEITSQVQGVREVINEISVRRAA